MNFCLCKIYRFIYKNPYPLEILPRINYKAPIDIDKLSQTGDYYVLRRSNKPYEDTFNELDILREDVIEESDVPGLSLNILGGKFKLPHLKYVPKRAGMKEWHQSEKLYFIDYKNDYEVLTTVSPVFFYLKDINNRRFPYKRALDKDSNKLVKALKLDLATIQDGDKVKFSGSSKIVHVPTKLNYWHVEFKIYDVQNIEIKKVKSAWTTSAAEYALGQIISVSAKSSINSISDIPQSAYLLNP